MSASQAERDERGRPAEPARRAWSGPLLVLAGAVLLSFAPVFVKLAAVGPTVAGVWRNLFGGLMLLGLSWAWSRRRSGGRWLGLGAGRGRGRAWRLALLGGVLFALDLTFWHQSVHLVGPGLGTILLSFQALFMAGYGALFLGERPGWRLILAAPLGLMGLGLLAGVGQDLNLGDATWRHWWGLVCGLIGGLAYTGYLLSLRRLQALPEAPPAAAGLTVISFVTAAVMALIALMRGEAFAIPDWPSGLWLVAYGLVGQVLGWLCISRGLPATPAATAGLLLLLQPTLAFVWDIALFGRPTDAAQYAGAALALIAIHLGLSGQGRRARPGP
ncbi:MAG: DMT family transporter [Pseudomonadota bacterium]